MRLGRRGEGRGKGRGFGQGMTGLQGAWVAGFRAGRSMGALGGLYQRCGMFL